MPSLKQNYFIGIKTPWTLENEMVWKKTHRITARIMDCWWPNIGSHPISNIQSKYILVYMWGITFYTNPISNIIFVCDFPTT